jgi:hypothetical protein
MGLRSMETELSVVDIQSHSGLNKGTLREVEATETDISQRNSVVGTIL